MASGQNGLEQILVGKKVDTYLVDEPLGNPGAFGIVYKVHIATQPTIFKAMKVYLKELSSNPEFMKSFNHETECWRKIQETESRGKISLENIVRVYETGVVTDTDTQLDGCAYLMMEYMDGGTLGDLMMGYMNLDPESQTPDRIKIEIKEALWIFAEAAKGIDAAHGADTLHCDVHAKNILLNKERKIVKIGDFGVSRIIKNISLPYTRVTADAKRYSSPEQRQEHKVYRATDVYQLGATMLEQFANLAALSGYEPILSENPNIPDGLKKLIRDCLQWKTGDRPELGKVIEELTSIRSGIIEREERYSSLIRESAAALNQIGKRANSNKSRVLNAPDIEELYKRVRAYYDTLNREGFDTQVDELELIINGLLQRDSTKWMDFARKFDNTEIQVVSPTVAEMARTYRQAIVKWEELTDKRFLRVLPDYILKVE
jgi:serine/threonine protein kinase